jgi:hypothetical protein
MGQFATDSKQAQGGSVIAPTCQVNIGRTSSNPYKFMNGIKKSKEHCYSASDPLTYHVVSFKSLISRIAFPSS